MRFLCKLLLILPIVISCLFAVNRLVIAYMYFPDNEEMDTYYYQLSPWDKIANDYFSKKYENFDWRENIRHCWAPINQESENVINYYPKEETIKDKLEKDKEIFKAIFMGT